LRTGVAVVVMRTAEADKFHYENCAHASNGRSGV
jgi:hypothetical protein